MKAISKEALIGTIGFVAVSKVWEVAWQMLLVRRQYYSLGLFNRELPNLFLGTSSLIVQGGLFVYLFTALPSKRAGLRKGIYLGLLLGLFAFSISTLGTAANFRVRSVPLWMALQAVFHTIQFAAAGALIAWAYSAFKPRGRAD